MEEENRKDFIDDEPISTEKAVGSLVKAQKMVSPMLSKKDTSTLIDLISDDKDTKDDKDTEDDKDTKYDKDTEDETTRKKAAQRRKKQTIAMTSIPKRENDILFSLSGGTNGDWEKIIDAMGINSKREFRIAVECEEE